MTTADTMTLIAASIYFLATMINAARAVYERRTKREFVTRMDDAYTRANRDQKALINRIESSEKPVTMVHRGMVS